MTNMIPNLSTLHSNLTARRFVERSRAELEQVGQELSTGYKADIAKDLGMQSSQAIAFRNAMDKTEGYITGNKVLESKLSLLSGTMDNFRNEAQSMMDLAVTNASSPAPTVDALQAEAKATLDALTSHLNVNYNGEYLFAGIDANSTPVQSYSETNNETGYSPQGVVEGIVGTNIASPADAATKIAELDAIFDSSNTVNPDRNFEGTFFKGMPLEDAGGNPNKRINAIVADDQKIEYGKQANDPAFTEILKGVSMIAGLDPAEIDNAAGYDAWMNEAINSMASGIKKLGVEQADIGKKRESLDEIITQQEDKKGIYNNRIVALEGVDHYEAASRMSALETQLEATYSVTAKISQLSFLNFMG
ncbi:flagellin [Salipiger mucosus]|uniref:Flagellin n=1 Tax=Salipiger mucosus DSM 16094 TaxID=1123237 RepID=S9QEP0_9RHOB|nr:flagellin [Salipiger mucosus]EPX78028.1 Flagellar hook-associated protein FlgL [Salipiger mucosus DSM 16094]